MDIQTAMEKRVAQLWARARVWLPGKLDACPPPIRLNNRLTSTMGQAFSDRHNPRYGVCLSTKLMHTYGYGGFHYETIPHEVAHIVADQALRSKGHDMPWRCVMGFYGLPEAWRCWSEARMLDWQELFKAEFDVR